MYTNAVICSGVQIKPVLIGLSVTQSVFLKSVTLYNSGDFSNSARNMEQAITQYFEIYNDCLAGCEGSYEILEFKDFFPTLAGESRDVSELGIKVYWLCSVCPPCFPQISTPMC